MRCPDCADGYYYPFAAEREKCRTCNGTCQVILDINRHIQDPMAAFENTALYVRLGRSKAAPVSEFGRFSWYRRGDYANILHQCDGFKAEYLSLKNAMVPIGNTNDKQMPVYDDDPRFKDLFDESRDAQSLFFGSRLSRTPPDWVFAMEVGLQCHWTDEPVLWNLHPSLARFLVLGTHPLPGVPAADNLAPEHIGKTLFISTIMWTKGQHRVPYPVVNHA